METKETKETNETNETNDAPYELDEVLCKQGYDTDMNHKHVYIWPQIIGHAILQVGWLIGLYTAFFHAKPATVIWGFFVGFLISESIALGAHRYYSHKSFKAKLPLQVALMLLQTMAGQNSMFTWVRDHKLHHKYSDTDADPHNSTRGFFFCHMGWLMVKKHPLLLKKQKEIDISDILQDKLIMFQYKYYLIIYIIMTVLFLISVPMYFWNETFWSAFFVPYILQYVTNLHITWTINSFAHLWGTRPYDKRIKAVQSTISWIVTAGEGWHNYHHAFPWDCRLSEYGQSGGLSTTMLDLLAYVGLAYDLKVASPKVVYGHMKRHGDETGQKIIAKKAALKEQQNENVLNLFLRDL